MASGQRDPQGWGFAGEGVAGREREELAGLLAARFPGMRPRWEPAAPLPDLPAPRVRPPAVLAARTSSDTRDRCLHGLGRSYVDVVRARRGEFPHAPDLVVRPRDEREVAAVLDWCATAGAQCVPFGGGTSVVGGVEARDDQRPVIALQLRCMDRVVDVDRTSLAACVQAGATGPRLEEQLRTQGLTLRFFPQSFELSTVGGWIATRAAGHHATGPTRIDDLVEALTAVTPAGEWETRRLPSSGAGPPADRLLGGSEGALGVLTRAWVRVRPRPVWRAAAALRFDDFAAGTAAVRALAQSGLQPASCRLLDPVEALLAAAGDGSAAVLLVGFEHADRPVGDLLALAVELARDAGGVPLTGTGAPPPGTRPVEPRAPVGDDGRDRDDPTVAWRTAFLRAPYLRDALVGLGALAETFETAVTWDRLDGLLARVQQQVGEALVAVCGDGLLTFRTTHAYPDGVAVYVTVLAPAARGGEAAQWAEVKAASAEAVLAAGGTITHHHAVGRDHVQWYRREVPAAHHAALAAAKAALDPGRVLNPGVLGL